MDNKIILKTIEEIKKKSKKRNFSQAYDLVVTLKDLNLKNPDEQVDFFATMPNNLGKKIKVAAFVGPELKDSAKKVCDTVVDISDFDKYKDKKLAKDLARTHDFFIAQAEIMPKVAATFGRILGPRGKMPNPKLGSVVPGKGGQIEPLYKKLQNTVKLSAKKSPMLQVKVGNQDMDDEKVAENALYVYNQIVHHLPREKSNVKNILLKLTMSEPIKVE